MSSMALSVWLREVCVFMVPPVGLTRLRGWRAVWVGL
jgi:uncharacterized membrane protein YqaE (UPF0057 family)